MNVPNGIRVFLGSTRKDLEDVRRAVLDAFKVAEAVAVEMDNWDADHENAVKVCREMLEQKSTHYVGVFAYWRGWKPWLKLSITEAEYQWAYDCRRGPPCQMAVFVPNPCSPFDLELRARATGQAAEDVADQGAFLKRVEGTYQVFDDPTNLALKVYRTLWRWSTGGLRRAAGSGSWEPAGRLDRALLDLGRQEQLRQFEDTLKALPRDCPGACFLLQGPQRFGHGELTHRLCLALERKTGLPPDHFSLAATSAFGGSLAGALCLELEAASPQPLGEIASRLRARLDAADVVLQVRSVGKYPGSLPGLLREFWAPLLQALGPRARRRLFLMAELEGKAGADWPLQPPGASGGFDPARAVRLAPLARFERDELLDWLSYHAPHLPESFADELLNETDGDPERLVNELRRELSTVEAVPA